jgi:hypothetical protein
MGVEGRKLRVYQQTHFSCRETGNSFPFLEWGECQPMIFLVLSGFSSDTARALEMAALIRLI